MSTAVFALFPTTSIWSTPSFGTYMTSKYTQQVTFVYQGDQQTQKQLSHVGENSLPYCHHLRPRTPIRPPLAVRTNTLTEPSAHPTVTSFEEWWEGDEEFYPGYQFCEPMAAPVVVGPKIEDFFVLACKGKGTYGRVVAVKERASRKLYCIKVFEKARLNKLGGLFSVYNEVEVYQRMVQHPSSPFLNEVLASFHDSSRAYIVSPLLEQDLFSVGGVASGRSVREVTLQVACGLAALHGRGIIHLDLKPQNILIDCHGGVRITDFGLSYVHPTAPLRRGMYALTTRYGTAQFRAPEFYIGPYDCMVDYWALGVTIYWLLTGEYPFADMAALGEFYIQNGDMVYYWQARSGLSFEEATLIAKLLNKNPARRFDHEDLACTTYYRGIGRRDPYWRYRLEQLAQQTYDIDLPQQISVGDTSLEYGAPLGSEELATSIYVYPDELLANLNWRNPRGPWAEYSRLRTTTI